MTDRIEPIDYLLGELDPQGTARAEGSLADDPEFRAEIERLGPIVGALSALPAEAWEPPEPPPLRMPGGASWSSRIRRSFLARLLQPIRLPAPALGGLVAVVLLAGVVVGATLFSTSAGNGEGGTTLALESVGTGRALGEARVEDGGTRLNVSVEGLAANGEADVYEVWLLTGPDQLLSLGSFRVGETGTGAVDVPLPVELSTFASIDISREPVDGDPTHSSDSVLRGPTA